jgi:MFS family permease
VKKNKKIILLFIVLSQFAGTSLWFVGNAVLPDLKQALHLNQYAISLVTSAVMMGFVTGTLVFAFFSLADRFSPAKLFFISSVAGAICNAAVVWFAKDAASLFGLRFLTGFFIAGIYPVGMKIAADWFEKGLGKALGFLLGALVLGTAFPHLLKNSDFHLPWKSVLYFTSGFAIAGGIIMILFVGDGPYRKKSGGFKWNAIAIIFQSKKLRQASLGYFGHMWELYTFWGFVPAMLALYAAKNSIHVNIPLLSFLIIGCGSLSCIAGGYLSQRTGSAKVAVAALFLSAFCCVLSLFIFSFPLWLFLTVLFIWGLAVIPDSPQFSTLVAQYAPEELKGTALTIYNSIGFTISILSLIIIDHVFHSNSFIGGKNTFLLLFIGPAVGIIPMVRLIKKI